LRNYGTSIIKPISLNKDEISNFLAIGIDTGKSGGICMISGSNMVTMKCPASIHEMADIIRNVSEMDRSMQIMACVEKNHSWTGQGVKSTWTFGYNSGAWEAILCSFNIPYMLVPPIKWMRHFSVPKMDKAARKKYLKHEAIKLYPYHKKQITLATADAILIAKYAKDIHIK
tara:strand:+ start:435 stop:950 length:516 start_codon:yes stop_codon:yes gene_type:complete